jgi:hypothetical protein
MIQTAKVGTILIKERPPLAAVLAIESDPYSDNWGIARALNGFTLDRQIHAAGWNFFFIAAEVKVMFFGPLGAERIQCALRRILAKVRHQNFNSLEVTGIVSRNFLGIPYGFVSAHSRHIQQNSLLDGVRTRARV